MIRRANLDKRWETKINHERWLVSYADFITLLFAFFVVMYSVSQVSDTKYRELSQTLQSTFAKKVSGKEDMASDTPVGYAEKLQSLQLIESEIQQLFQGELKSLVDLGAVNMTGNRDWLEIELSSGALFASGKAELTATAQKTIEKIADTISLSSNRVIVSGHTDNIPIANDQFPNNWALASARAVAVVNALAYGGVNPARLSAVGYGEFQPVADNQTEEGRRRNRRVVISVSRSAEEPSELQLQQQAPLLQQAELGNTNLQDPAAQERPALPLDLPSGNTDMDATNEEPAVQPVRLQDGSLLFSSDPGLPRVNPVVSPEP